jgi:hypothetical protein
VTLEEVIIDFIESIPAAERLYPDLFADRLAERIRESE